MRQVVIKKYAKKEQIEMKYKMGVAGAWNFARKYMMVLLLLLLIVFFTTVTDSFFTPYNLFNIVNQSVFVIIAGIGITFVMISGGMDLSIGYQISLSCVITGLLMRDYGFGTLPAILVCMAVGTTIGLINGFLSVKLRVISLIITLAMAYTLQGVSSILSNSETIRGFPKSFEVIGQGKLLVIKLGANDVTSMGSITFAILIMIALVGIASFILNKSYFGRYIYGIGGNEESMRLAGINVDRTKILLYGICGMFASLAAIVLASRTGSVSVNTGVGTEFTCLTACVVGGISLKGGEGHLWGMVVGVLLVNVLSNGMQLMGMGQYPQYVAKGIVLIAAVGFDAFQKRMKTTQPKSALRTAG